ncbi:MAG TPA: DUF3332 domain-containing protein [Flavobacteriaceae bacterium]|nr:DUF3332 domain-containing protein [Flavobacteriaceae bacterium]
MKKIKLFTLLLAATILSSSCLGSFSAFNNLKDWNHQVSDSKFVNNLLFWGLNIIPVYPLFFVGDTLIFNVIEFWSGSNPIAMSEGEIETETFVKNGEKYEMIATKNQFVIKGLEGINKDRKIVLNYIPEEKTWFTTDENGEKIKLSSMKDGFHIVYMPNGEEVKLDPFTARKDGKAILNSKIVEYYSQNTVVISEEN